MSELAPPSTPEGEGFSNFTPASYDIAPEDAELAAQITNFDPLRDVAGPVSSDVPLKIGPLSREMLSGDVRAQVDARLEEMPARDRTPQAEQAVMLQELQRYDYAVKVWGGPGPNADAYQREHFIIEHELSMARQALVERQSKLLDVISHERRVDQASGEVWFEPQYVVRGDARSAAEHEVAELKQRIALLEGSEGKRRLAQARWQAVEDHKRLRDEVAIDKEAQAIAKSEERAARVAEKAKAYRKFAETER